MKRQRRYMTKLPQYWKMVELLRDKPDIGQGSLRRGRAELDEFWFKLAEECNLLGPPLKKPDLWKRTWYDFKQNMRLKYDKCKKMNTMHYLTNLEREVIKICDFENVKIIKPKYIFVPDVDRFEPTTTSPTPPSAKGNNSVDIEILSEGEIVKEEFLYDSDEDNSTATVLPAIDLNDQDQHPPSDFHSDSPPEKLRRTCSQLQSQDDPMCTTSAHYNEEEGEEEGEELNEIKLLQQQIDIQKNLYKETKEFQVNTSSTLQDISLTLNLIRGSVETIEDLNVRRLKEHVRHNRKIEELLQKLTEREISMENKRK